MREWWNHGEPHDAVHQRSRQTEMKWSPLSDLAEINPRSPLPTVGETVSFVAMADVSESGLIDNLELRKASSGYTPFATGDVLVAKITSCFENGKGAHVGNLPTRCGLGSTEFHVLRPRSNTSGRYLYHLTREARFRLRGEGMMSGSAGQRRVPSEFFSRYAVWVPPLEEQRRIAEILDTIDETIQATERLITKLETMKLGIIDTSLCRMTGWNTELGSVCSGPGEYGCVAAAEERRAGWPRYVRITDLTDSGELHQDLDMGVSPFVAQKSILREGDIVFARSGATVGKTYLYDSSDGLCAFAGYLIRFQPDPTRVLSEFVRLWTHSSAYWGWVKQTMREGAQPNINAQEYGRAVLPVPPIEEQRTVVDSVARLTASIDSERRRCAKLRATRAGLAADLLSGRVRTVPV